MKNIDGSSFFYEEVINLINLDHFDEANKLIKKNIITLENSDDIALAYLNCAFINDKIGDNLSAIDAFSKSISIESELENISYRSKDISFSGRSNSKYKSGDNHGAIQDKRMAKKISLLELEKCPDLYEFKIDYKSILLGTYNKIELEPKYRTLIQASRIKKSKYDLISDYKKVISKSKQEEVMKKLEYLSETKYNIGDYKGSIKALRRAEKYYL